MIQDPNFSLELAPPWELVSTDEPETYGLHDPGRDIVATVSAMTHALAPGEVKSVAENFVQLRLNAEADAARAFDRGFTIYEPVLVPRAWGHAGAYYGHDDTGRQFGFSALVTARALISLYMSSMRLSERELMEAMDEVATCIAFDRTPLD